MAGKGLSEEEFIYVSSKTPLINVDLFIVNEFEELLFSWRDDEHCGTGWHIPGGVIRHSETMKERLILTAKRELGFTPVFEDTPCKITEIFLDQEYRNHSISLLFRGHCKKSDVSTIEEAGTPGDLKWFNYYPGIVYSQVPYEEYLKEYFSNIQAKKCVTESLNHERNIRL